jgi:glucose/arabinose dehydrogenase
MRRLIVIALFAVAASAQNVAVRQLAGGLDQPLGVTHAGDSRLFVIQQRGTIVIWNGTRILPAPFLDIRSLVSCCGERGLLGLAFHPQYRQNGLFFVYYTATSGDITIARYRVSSDPDRADAASGSVILTVAHRQFSNHNGGQLQFGPDGYLYAGTGDGGSGGDPSNNAQSTTTLLGKILRIDVNAPPYAVPSSNPFRNEIWAYGLRNPWRFSFDRATGDLWIGDVGQNQYEEIDLQRATSIGGENYGWRRMEGLHCFNPSTGCADSSLVPPVLEYSHADGSCSVTGGYRYRGAFARMKGAYFYGDYCTGVIWGATENANRTWNATKLLTTTFRITSFGEDVNGELYVVDQNGAIYQIIDPLPPPPRRRAVAK